MQKKNQIQAYSFGSINVNGETYTQDIIIYPKKLKTNWRRERGHILNTADIKEIIEYLIKNWNAQSQE
ncbi:MAG: hypothetical protein ACOC4Z_02990, partial [Patescibacteria group bacterium]